MSHGLKRFPLSLFLPSFSLFFLSLSLRPLSFTGINYVYCTSQPASQQKSERRKRERKKERARKQSIKFPPLLRLFFLFAFWQQLFVSKDEEEEGKVIAYVGTTLLYGMPLRPTHPTVCLPLTYEPLRGFFFSTWTSNRKSSLICELNWLYHMSLPLFLRHFIFNWLLGYFSIQFS